MNIFTLNTANYDDHKGWTARLPFIVDTIIQTNADVIGLSEIRYDAANPFNQYAAQYWESIPAPGPTNSTPSMGDQILALLTAKSGSNSCLTSESVRMRISIADQNRYWLQVRRP